MKHKITQGQYAEFLNLLTPVQKTARAYLVRGGTVGGPVRVGIFARPGSTTRQEASASYWGITELSGNLWERTISVGISNNRLFTGLHGNGALTSAGLTDVTDWPTSHGWRGSHYNYHTVAARSAPQRPEGRVPKT